MNNKYNIYLLSESYYDYLKEQKLYEIELKNERPYIGFIKIKISKYDYLIPLTSKSNKYSIHHKYSIPTYENNKISGILLINKMIPILDNKNFITKLNEKSFSNKLKMEIDYINNPKIISKIISLANEARKMQDTKLKFNVNFEHAEELCEQFELINTKEQKIKQKTYKINYSDFEAISQKYIALLSIDTELEKSFSNPNNVVQSIKEQINGLEKAMTSATSDWYLNSEDPIYLLTPSLKRITKGYERHYKEYGENILSLSNDLAIEELKCKKWVSYENLSNYEKQLKNDYGKELYSHLHQLTDWPSYIARTISNADENNITPENFKIIIDKSGKEQILKFSNGEEQLKDLKKSPFITFENVITDDIRQEQKKKNHKLERENNMENQTNNIQTKYFSIFLSIKNIKREYEKQILVSIPKLGLAFIPKSTTASFEVVNKKTGEIKKRLRIAFSFDHDYTLFNRKQEESIETPFKGKELYESLKQKTESKEINVGLKLSPVLENKDELSKKAKSKKLDQGMEM